jgi:hypothetical protein
MKTKDYKLIAECLARIEDKCVRANITTEFILKLAEKNPRFDANIFLLAVEGAVKRFYTNVPSGVSLEYIN